jgi:DHA2 family multidrug resistance protein
MTVVLGPVIGPAAGGWLAEQYNWRWAFYMIVPAGALAAVALRFALPPDRDGTRVALDWTGFLTLSVGLAALQLVLSRGERLDWFQSTEIILACGIAAVAFYCWLAHSLTTARPFLDLNLLRDRNYALGLVLVTIYGMVNFTPTVLLPTLLQSYANYPDSIIGLIVGYRGIGGTLGFGATLLIGRWDPRIGLGIGFGILVGQGLWLMSLDLNVGVDELLWNSLLQGFGIGVIWVPLTILTFATLDSRHTAEAMSLFHLLRNIGSSLFISLSVAEIIRSGAANYSRMTELITPTSKVLAMPGAMGGWSVETLQGLTSLSREIGRQAAMIGYLNAFGMYTAVAAAAIVLALLARGKKPAAAA